MHIIKLGGSVITDKKRYRKFRRENVERLCVELKGAWDAGKRFILVHGAGSFGHIKAREYQLQAGRNPKIKNQSFGFARVHCDVRHLNLKIMEILTNVGLSPVSLPPLSVALNTNGTLKLLNLEKFENALRESLVPLTFGDVVFDEKLGFSICSGDDLVFSLATYFKPERIIFVCDVPGIYARFPPRRKTEILKEITPEQLGNLSAANPKIDVTGGIFRKIQKSFEFLASQRNAEVWIISGKNFDNFRNALIGKEIYGTRVVVK